MTIKEKEDRGVSKYAGNVSRIIVNDLDGNYICEYPCMKAAAEGLGLSTSGIHAAVKRGTVVKKKYRLEAIKEDYRKPKPKESRMQMIESRKQSYFDWKGHKPYATMKRGGGAE